MSATSNTPNVVEQPSTDTFAVTLSRVERAIVDAGLAIFARIDHAANANAVGLDMPPATVLIYGNARGGTPLMQAAPLAALDLPLHVLVRADEAGHASVVFHPIAPVLSAAGVPHDLAARLDGAQALLLKGFQS